MGPMKSRGSIRWPRKLAFSAVTALALFALVECGLRVSGFERPTRIEALQFTFPLDDYNAASEEPYLQRDAILFWKPTPGVMEHNSLGTRGPEFQVPKPDGLFRVVALGDSCTHFGSVPYPRLLERMLGESAVARFDVVNAGVIGFTSHQGLARMTTEVAEWEPDLVTVYFGWNDHWLARGLRDSSQRTERPLVRRLHDALGGLRSYQALVWAVRSGMTAAATEYRVSLDEYSSNLKEIAAAAGELGAGVWFITAPHALDLGIPDYLETSGEVADLSTLIELHRAYNGRVRQAAVELGIPLIDLEREFDALDKRPLFVDDHIHLSAAGRTLAARFLFDEMVAHGMVTRGR